MSRTLAPGIPVRETQEERNLNAEQRPVTTGEQRPAKPGPKSRKPTGRTPAWALKLGSALFAFAIFGGSFDYASQHLATANAPLQPTVVAVAASTGPTVTPRPTVSTTTRAPVTKTASS